MNKTMKRIASIVLVSAVALSFAACSKKKALSAEDFTSKMEKEGFTVSDPVEEGGYTMISASNEDYTISVNWAKYDDNDKAKSDFETVEEMYKSLKSAMEEQGVEVSTSSSEIVASSNTQYIYCCISGSTIVSITAEGSEDAVSSAKDVKKALGL